MVCMKKLFAGCCVVLVSAVASVSAMAQTIAVVDTQRIVNESIVGKAARNNLEVEIKKGQAKLAQLKGDFEKQKSDLEKQAAILSGAALEAKREALSKKQVDLQRDVKAKGGERWTGCRGVCRCWAECTYADEGGLRR